MTFLFKNVKKMELFYYYSFSWHRYFTYILLLCCTLLIRIITI